ncbi:MAG: hypothetical protein MUF70_08245 [Myxococcota bacterium]|nr:hypothetical protein [Myxococcota bacterium]
MSEAPDASVTTERADFLGVDLAEDLGGNLRLARRSAPVQCRPAPGRDVCDWYHGFYPLLRCVGAAAAPERHARFYAEALGPFARHGEFGRVLIPGAADSGMLRCVLSTLRATGARARIRVLDRCETPLSLCRSFAARCGTAIETETFDLLGTTPTWNPDGDPDGDPDGRFDVACTHSLLAFFPPARRRAGIEACRARLRSGGKLVSTARIDPATSDAGTRFTPAGARAFATRIHDAAAARGVAADLAPDSAFDLALRYAERMVSWPFASPQQLVADLEASGFAVDRLDVVDVPGHLGRDVAGAGTHQHAVYAEFVASRV